MSDSFRAAVTAARRQGDLYFAALLSEQSILHALGSASSLWQGWVYTPAVTVWVFLSQCLSADHSCRDAVARLAAWRVAQGLSPCSADTGGYCIARSHLPEEACRQLVRPTGREVEDEAAAEWLWRNRRVRIVDGSTITMADTPENQAAYPQLKSQERGCGFPIARILVVFSLSVGTVLEAAISQYEGKLTGENSLFRQLHNLLAAGDVVLADRYFSGWFDMALLDGRGIDVVVRKHQLRPTDFRRGVRLGKDDQLVRWSKPQRPKWMTRDEYQSLPDELALREVRVRVKQKGFRTKSLVVVTTLTEATEYPSGELAELYRRRWQAELNLRSLKGVLQMDHLRCKMPERIRNEFSMHLLGYNLIRRAMVLFALSAGAAPWQVSFKGTLQTLNQFLPLLGAVMPVAAGCDALINCIAAHEVGNRLNRYEPRLVKRRLKKYKHLREPRDHYRNRMK